MSETSDFIDSFNQLISLAFPCQIELGKSYYPSRESFENAIYSWQETKKLLKIKYWSDWESSLPNTYNADHMTLFSYLLAKEEVKLGKSTSADRICYLNRIRNGINVWHSVDLPGKTLFVHAIGSVIGNATFGTSLVCYQNVTVGGSKGKYPVFQGSCVIFAGASVIGNCSIGDNVVIGAGALVIDEDIPANSTVIGKVPNLRVLPLGRTEVDEFFAK
jgi:serine O-acetyltransferase